jgi:hypothetical protein
VARIETRRRTTTLRDADGTSLAEIEVELTGGSRACCGRRASPAQGPPVA